MKTSNFKILILLFQFQDPDLKVWVGDALHEATGISDKTIAEFLMGLAKNAKSSNDFIDKIKATETIGNVQL